MSINGCRVSTHRLWTSPPRPISWFGIGLAIWTSIFCRHYATYKLAGIPFLTQSKIERMIL